MQTYHKILTVFSRSPESKFKTLIDGAWARGEFEWLQDNEWVFTEKVDGTNIRVNWDGLKVEYGGRTDNAQIPTFLLHKLDELFTVESMQNAFGTPSNSNFILHGEGYGAKIQKGGGDYIQDGCSFILFDVRYDDIFLKREDVEDVATKLDIPVVPIVGYGPLSKAVQMAKNGFESCLRATPPEGLVMRPAVELKDRLGHRVITKIKLKDFNNA